MKDRERLADREQRLAKIRELVGPAAFKQNRELLEEADAVQEAALFVRQMREHAGLTQSALGEKLGVTQPRISQIERGNSPEGISYSLLRRVASVCGFVHWPVPPLQSRDLSAADAHEEGEHGFAKAAQFAGRVVKHAKTYSPFGAGRAGSKPHVKARMREHS